MALIGGGAKLIKQYLAIFAAPSSIVNEQLNQVQPLYIAEFDHLSERSRLPMWKNGSHSVLLQIDLLLERMRNFIILQDGFPLSKAI